MASMREGYSAQRVASAPRRIGRKGAGRGRCQRAPPPAAAAHQALGECSSRRPCLPFCLQVSSLNNIKLRSARSAWQRLCQAWRGRRTVPPVPQPLRAASGQTAAPCGLRFQASCQLPQLLLKPGRPSQATQMRQCLTAAPLTSRRPRPLLGKPCWSPAPGQPCKPAVHRQQQQQQQPLAQPWAAPCSAAHGVRAAWRCHLCRAAPSLSGGRVRCPAASGAAALLHHGRAPAHQAAARRLAE